MDRTTKKKVTGKVKAFLPFYLFAFLLLNACGDFWESDSAEMTTARQMVLGRRVVTLVAGDHYCIPVNFTPDSLHNNTVFWQTMDNDVARFVDDTLIAVSEGVTRAIAFTTVDRLRDTCWVQVVEPLNYTYGRYLHDMIIYASVDVHGTKLTVENADTVIIAAFAGNELRGIGQMLRLRDIDYMVLRVESPIGYGEQIRVRCYYPGCARFEMFPDIIPFTGESVGRPSQLLSLVLGNDAEVYEPDISELLDNEIIVVPDTLEVELPADD